LIKNLNLVTVGKHLAVNWRSNEVDQGFSLEAVAFANCANATHLDTIMATSSKIIVRDVKSLSIGFDGANGMGLAVPAGAELEVVNTSAASFSTKLNDDQTISIEQLLPESSWISVKSQDTLSFYIVASMTETKDNDLVPVGRSVRLSVDGRVLDLVFQAPTISPSTDNFECKKLTSLDFSRQRQVFPMSESVLSGVA
jgi:hypothetical protein